MTDAGVISRQELVSILPTLFLLHPNLSSSTESVLDMCAAPGSKTLQVLEALQVLFFSIMLLLPTSFFLPVFMHSLQGTDSLVVANDLSRERLYKLINRQVCSLFCSDFC